MPTKIGHFEILSELSKSATGAVYKANDPQTSQTVALKAIQLSAFGERAAELEKCLMEEAEIIKVLSHSNITPVYGAGEMDGQFCAAMEYIQGNSIATMLERKEGFSIWDLLDIGRQVCGGLDHAHSHNAFHFSLEPAKIMCGWDGTVRILGYGVSSVGKFAGQMQGVPSILHYMSPEQVRGEDIDARSNLFSLGAIFYEMVSDHKAFEGEDAESLSRSILEETPAPPTAINPKVHPLLNDLIMKALAKDPAQRYQSGKEMLDDLEKCKESKPQAAKQPAPAPKGVAIPDAVKAATQAKFAGASASRPLAGAKPVAPGPVQKPAVQNQTVQKPVVPVKATAAAASAGSRVATPSAPKVQPSNLSASPASKTKIDAPRSASMSSAGVDEPAQAEAPRIVVDPMMAEGAPSQGGGGAISFSEMTELPPLKEVYIPPPPPPALERQASHAPGLTTYEDEPEKPKVQPREVAEKAIKEIKNVPPRLMVYSIAGAAVVILIIAIALVLHVNSLNSDGDSPRSTTAEATQPAPSQPAVQNQPVQSQPTQPAPTVQEPVAEPAAPEAEAERRGNSRAAVAARGRNSKKRSAPAPAPVLAPGQMAIDSTPPGVQVQVDGRTDPSWVTPFTLSGLAAGRHSITFSKAGYSSDTRAVDVVSGSKSFVVTHLAQLVATLAVSSTPAGANIYVDGKNMVKLTPAQVSVDKGQHVVLVRKAGFIDETTNAQFMLGQTVSFSPTLRPLGNVDDIRTVGKMKKLFGGKEAQGMGTVSVRTQPKGAQVAVNQHMLDKESPVEFILDPGNYMVDITMTGYAPIHKVITVDRGGKAVIDEVMQHE